MEEQLIKQFSLPSYVKGKSFAEASKAINNKFKDRDDKYSTETKQALLERLSQAQEYVKQQSQPQQPEQPQMPAEQPQMAPEMGMSGQEGVDPQMQAQMEQMMAQQGNQPPQMNPMQNQAAFGAIFGDDNDRPNIQSVNELETQGIADIETDTTVETGNIGSDLADGASGGASPNIGGYLKAAGTAYNFGNQLFGSSDLQEGQKRESAGATIGKSALTGASAGMSFGPWGAAIGGVIGAGVGIVSSGKNKKKEKDYINNATYAANNQYNASGKSKNLFDDESNVNMAKYGDTFTDPDPITPDYYKHNSRNGIDSIFSGRGGGTDFSSKNTKTDEKEEKEKKPFNPLPALRYAPAIMDAYQLSQLDGPDVETLGRLNNRYKPSYMDERSLINNVNDGFNKGYVKEASAGNLGSYMANSRAAELSKTRALSNAYAQANEVNRREDSVAQQFNLGVDRTNLQQGNLENDINARNRGNYDTQKSRLLGNLGTTIGSIGKEEKYKQMVKDSGLCYDSRGAYICGSGERLTDEQAKEASSTNENKYGGTVKSEELFSSYLDTLLNKDK